MSNVNQYPNLGVKEDGTKLCGLYSAQYSLTRNIASIYSVGSSDAIARYGELPNIELSFSQHLGAGDVNYTKISKESKIELTNRGGSVVCDKAFLTKINYTFNIDGPFLLSKTYLGYLKGKGGGGSGSESCKDQGPIVYTRKDYTGGFPPGISSSALVSVNVEISIDRQLIGEFATRRPYASYIVFPIKTVFTYEAYTDGVDTLEIDDMKYACGNANQPTYSLNAAACGHSVSTSNAYLTSLSYSGGDANKGAKPQTVTVSFTSFENPSKDLEPVYIFP